MTHPGLLTLEHEDLRNAFAAILHKYCQQRVVGAAVQHSFGFLDATQRQHLQLCLQNHIEQDNDYDNMLMKVNVRIHTIKK